MYLTKLKNSKIRRLENWQLNVKIRKAYLRQIFNGNLNLKNLSCRFWGINMGN